MTRHLRPHTSPAAARQRGQALLVILIIVGVAITALVFYFANPGGLATERDKKTAAALAQAKDALIGRAAADDNRPGSLPCPDLVTNIVGNVPNDGVADLLSGNDCPSYIGRLPWRTLGLPDSLRDGYGERLWYALSPAFRDDTSAEPINSDTTGQLTITGSAPATNVIAIVFSPEAVVGAQVRDAANENNVANYLEGGNETGIATNTFVSGQATTSFNDRLLPITSDALFPVVAVRVAREIRIVLLAYYAANGYFPNANPFDVSVSSWGPYPCRDNVRQGRIPLTIQNPAQCLAQANWGGTYVLPSWFSTNNWNLVLFYAVASPCAGAFDALCESLGNPLNLFGSPTRALLIGTGRGFSSQANRPCGATNCTVIDLLEDAENTNGDDNFVNPVLSPTNNDRLVVVSP